MINNKSFCVYPFIHLAADPAGQIRPCCVNNQLIKKSNDQPYNLGYDKLEDIFNSPDFIEIRKKMVEGELVESCYDCYEQEAHSNFSQRTYTNEKWNHGIIENQIQSIIENDYKSDLQIRYLDLRLGNMCNLKCRSCDSINSSQLAKEITEIAYTNEKVLNYIPLRAVANDWYQTEQFHENLNAVKDSIVVVYMTGGEPTLIPENIEYLQSIVDNGRAHEVIVTINTNLTNAKPEFLSMLKNFQQVVVYASNDGYGDMQEYLRAPSNYEQVKKNLLAFSMLPNAQIKVTPVIQACNVNLITELFDELLKIQTKNMTIFPIVLIDTRHLSVSMLPSEFKKTTREQISSWLSKNIVPNSEFQLRMHTVMSMLEEPENSEELARFIEFTSIFDEHRNVSLQDINPDLAHAIGYK